jgi:hypothetical protein
LDTAALRADETSPAGRLKNRVRIQISLTGGF